MRGIPNKTQVGEQPGVGIDGRLYPVGTQPKTKDDLFADDWFRSGGQVKQVDKVGRPDIDAFQHVMERAGAGSHGLGRSVEPRECHLCVEYAVIASL